MRIAPKLDRAVLHTRRHLDRGSASARRFAKRTALVQDAVIVEVKSVSRHDPVFEAQLLTYLKATGKKVGLLINFNSRLVHEGIKRFIL